MGIHLILNFEYLNNVLDNEIKKKKKKLTAISKTTIFSLKNNKNKPCHIIFKTISISSLGMNSKGKLVNFAN